ncbi:MAG: response regulator [Deltaproteobacteria bacterium]|uniref:Response regulator n=1 Tax=Candidatus Zymogenus saltonus TaxID=2844893 RepID=A0A9D8PQ36_9DELT|nr:response regulator [Candidatus Zymogenus saltonus]
MDDVKEKIPQIEGHFTALSMISLVQGISGNKKMLIILYSKDGKEGKLYFDSSRIVGASLGDTFRGEKAFFRLIEWENARFQAFEVNKIKPENNNIKMELSHLLLEGLRQKDEKEKIKERILPIYKIKRAEGSFDLSSRERDLWEIINPRGSFVIDLVNATSITDFEAYEALTSLMLKKALQFVKIKTLVIDDSAFMIKILKDILEGIYRDTMAIKTLENGADAIRAINSSDPEAVPDLIFTDILMEGTGGMEVIKAARERDKPINTIAVTTLQREMRDILKAGANYLHKDWITNDDIEDIVKDLVERTISGELSVIGGSLESKKKA